MSHNLKCRTWTYFSLRFVFTSAFSSASRRYFLVNSAVPLEHSIRLGVDDQGKKAVIFLTMWFTMIKKSSTPGIWLKLWINYGKEASSWCPDMVTVMKPIVKIEQIPFMSDLNSFFATQAHFTLNGDILSLYSEAGFGLVPIKKYMWHNFH